MGARRRYWITLFLVSCLGMVATVEGQGPPLNAQIVAAFQRLGLWPYGIYVTGDFPVYNATVQRFLPSSGSSSVVLLPASTCAAPALAESGAATTGIAFTATPSILNCVGGTARTTLSATSWTSTVPILGPDGTVGSPTYSFANDTNLGFYLAATNNVVVANGGTGIMLWSPNLAQMGSGGIFGWTSTADASGAAADVKLQRNAANNLGLVNSTSAQRLDVANTYTSASNNELFSVDWQTTANTVLLGSRTAATGSSRSLWLVSQQGSGADVYAALQLFQNSGTPVKIGYYNAAGAIRNQNTYTTFLTLGEQQNIATSGTFTTVAVTPTYNQASGNAANTDLLINRTQTLVGSGAQLLIDAQVGGVSQFAVANQGSIGVGVAPNTSAVSATIASAGFVIFSGRAQIFANGSGLINFRESGGGNGVELNLGTAVPTVTTCGTGSVTANSTNTAGEFTATGATTCTLTFGAPNWTNTPFCVLTEETTAGPYRISAISATAFTATGFTSGDKFMYHCIGRR